jgi:hypothetical protein
MRLLMADYAMKLLFPRWLKKKKLTVLVNRAFYNYEIFKVVGSVILLLSTSKEKIELPTYYQYCTSNKLEPIPYWEDAQFAAESKVVKVVDGKTGLTMFESAWGQ